MRIWIDAETAPKAAREIVDRAARRLGIEATEDAAGFISAQAEPGDLVITHAIPLTESLMSEGVSVLDARGRELTAERVGEHPSLRSYLKSLRAPSGSAHGPPPFDAAARRGFAAGLDRLLARMTRTRP